MNEETRDRVTGQLRQDFYRFLQEQNERGAFDLPAVQEQSAVAPGIFARAVWVTSQFCRAAVISTLVAVGQGLRGMALWISALAQLAIEELLLLAMKLIRLAVLIVVVPSLLMLGFAAMREAANGASAGAVAESAGRTSTEVVKGLLSGLWKGAADSRPKR